MAEGLVVYVSQIYMYDVKLPLENNISRQDQRAHLRQCKHR